MLKPQGRADFSLHTSPPVFGKPWFWQRSSSTMESTRGLARVIMEMRDEIKKLETENRELRGGHTRCSVGPTSEEDLEEKEPLEKVENPYLNLRRNVSEPVLEGKFKENTVMTVRRYSTSSNLSGVTRGERINTGGHNNSGWRKLQEEILQEENMFSNSIKAEVQKVNTRHSLQEYVHKNRGKVKTVTFLLPVDDIYTSRPALIKQDEPTVTDLSSIIETDS